MPFRIFETEARSILSPVSGFLREAGFTHSLSPSRNCTFGCSYCYVPTMRVQAGLKPADWTHWGEWTTTKTNAATLLERALSSAQVIYCSPLTDPYQPAEETAGAMRGILEVIRRRPPRVLVIQTRGPLILRDIGLLQAIARHTALRVSFSITTEQEEIRRIFEPHCATLEERWRTVSSLSDAGIEVSVAVAPILPCGPEALIRRALESSSGPVVADPFHIRSTKPSGATTRAAATRICARHGWSEWLDPLFQKSILDRMKSACNGRQFGHGPAGFALLARTIS